MQLGIPGRPHLTYCTNIHPGESLESVRGAIVDHVVAVKRRIRPDGPFGVGLRLSARAARELSDPSALSSFRDLLHQHDLYVFTVNGFPHGSFHGERVKENVYRPDWSEEERLRYTGELATILAALLPAGVAGSISTVPGGFRERAWGSESLIADRLLRQVVMLHRLHEHTGRCIAVALEPEPACLLETTDDALDFFRRHLLDEAATRRVAELSGLDAGAAAAAVSRHLGVCLDCCHSSVEFEDPAHAAKRLRAAGIPIAKIQITAAPVVELRGDRDEDAPRLSALAAFDDPVYLHQTVIRSASGLTRFVDLPDALRGAPASDAGPAEWRVHFHVPVYESRLGPFTSTQPGLRELLALCREEVVSAHLEVETYTWDVLPPALRSVPVDEAIARELTWTLAELGGEGTLRAG